MDLAINGIRLVGRRLGVGRYLEYLLSHWKNSSPAFERIVVYTPREIEIELPRGGEQRVVPTRLSNGYWEQVALARLAQAHDLLFCPSYVVPLLARGKSVVTHLGSYEAVPSAFGPTERWRARLLYQLSAHRAQRVITVSESSKRDIVRFYRVQPDKIIVIPLGVDPHFRPLDDEALLSAARRSWLGADRPLILFVGKLSRRRRIPELIAAFARLKQQKNIPHVLLLIGPDTGGNDVGRLARSLDVEDTVLHRDFATHEELPILYNAASLFVYPSTYEGFGIPVLEAMACGTPTVALRNSSFLEFAEGVAHLAPDGSSDSLFEAMDLMLSCPDRRRHARTAGPARAQGFTWSSIADRTAEVLFDVGRANSSRGRSLAVSFSKTAS